MRGALVLVAGAIVFTAITFFEQIPILGWLGGILSVAAWVGLTRLLFDDRGGDALSGTLALVWAAVLGTFTGLVGAFTAWLAQTGNLFGFTTPPGDRFGAVFGFLGASLGLFYWPLVGALVCVVTALATASRRGRWRFG